jgi:SSS family solute:Na+ symporter
MFFPFIVILPGLIAIATPVVTQHAMVHMPRVHAQTAAATDAAAPAPEGRGLIPVKVDPVTGKVMLDEHGQPLLDYDLAIPNMLLHYFPTGILGLGLTALLASFMSGMAGNVTAFNTVWTYDLYQSYIHKNASDAHYLKMGRWATVGGILLSMATAYVAVGFNNIMDTLQLVFSFVNAPLFATFLLGMFWKRSTGHAAFTGLVSGTFAAVIHHGLTLPSDAPHAGIHGGWITVLHMYPSQMAQNFWTAIWAFSVNFIVTVVISLMTKPRPEPELVGLVYSLTPKPVEHHMAWYARPKVIAVGLIVLLIGLNLIFK